MRGLVKFILGAAIGGVIGSVLAFLFAPISGQQLRDRVNDYCTNIRDDVKNAAEMKRQELQNELLARQKKI
jgi:gas vesicle protein